ncbi:MAG: hypothetical protein ABUT20_34170 [Bacteroidota bacterium]
MKAKILTSVLIAVLFVISSVAYAQMYYTASGSEAVENNGKEWINKELPPAVIIFSDNPGIAELKADLSSIIDNTGISTEKFQYENGTLAVFKMNLTKKQIADQLYSGKIFTIVGFLKMNGVNIKVPAQYILEPSGDIENGFTISLVIRVNPDDFNVKIAGEAQNNPLLLKINSGVVSEI